MTDTDRESMIQRIVARPYRKEVRGDDVEGYLAEAPELPGCITAGRTPEDALLMLRDAMEGWIESALIAGEAIPEPRAAAVPA